MKKVEKLKIALFALTGFGNKVLEALLLDPRVEVAAVFTVKYDQPFPYYREQQLIEFCEQRWVDCYHGVKVSSDQGMELLQKYAPDLIMMATFKQILKNNVLSLPPLGVINFHPSLLPLYRGPCPTNNVLLNGEKDTGVTVHYATEALDEGAVLLQKSLAIGEMDNDGQLRQKLAALAGEMVPEIVGLFTGSTWPLGTPQDPIVPSLAPKPAEADGFLELASDIQTLQRKVKALNPIPGTSYLVGDNRIAVDRFESIPGNRPDGINVGEKSIDIYLESQGLRLFKKFG